MYLYLSVTPRIYSKSSLSVLKGSSVVINCTASGFPTPNITIVNPQGFATFKVPLLIPSVKVSDGGIYKCVATNAAGFSERNITLTVLGKSNAIVQIFSLILKVGQASCIAFRESKTFDFAI